MMRGVHSRRFAVALVAIVITTLAVPAWAGESVDLEMMTRIRQEEFRDSKVMDTLSELTDDIGPRLTGSPNMKRANEWTRDQFTKWGLVNAHLEAWGPFGRGWSEESAVVRMIAPDTAMLFAYPEAWTPGTPGLVRGKVVRARIERKEDFEKYHGKLAGAIVLLGEEHDVKPHDDAEMVRYDEKGLDEIYRYQAAMHHGYQRPSREEMVRMFAFRKQLAQFLAEEKPAVVIKPSSGDGGTIFVGGSRPAKDSPAAVPTLMMAVEHFGRIARLLERNVPVELEVEVRNKFYGDDESMAYNTVAEIPGSDKKDEIVMLGGHLDSWHGGTGAADNAAGVAACMEAVRILEALGVKPRRTIRIALWSGEEQGLLGSRAYVKQHLATRPEPTDPKEKELPEFLRKPAGPLTFKPEYKQVSAYFNIDNGGGKLRGIYTQENVAVRPLFESWIEPLKDLGVTTVATRNTGGTDHLSFDAVGVPGFQFIQDPLEYFSSTHHTNMDVYERIQREDLMQQAVVMAWFVYNAAMRDQMLPRKPLLKDDMNKSDGMPPTMHTSGSR